MRLKNIFAAVDSMSSVYRSLLPIPVWTYYFLSGPGSDLLPFFYLFTKGLMCIDQGILAFKAIKALMIARLVCSHLFVCRKYCF
jgi:hypothetical protein